MNAEAYLPGSANAVLKVGRLDHRTSCTPKRLSRFRREGYPLVYIVRRSLIFLKARPIPVYTLPNRRDWRALKKVRVALLMFATLRMEENEIIPRSDSGHPGRLSSQRETGLGLPRDENQTFASLATSIVYRSVMHSCTCWQRNCPGGGSGTRSPREGEEERRGFRYNLQTGMRPWYV